MPWPMPPVSFKARPRARRRSRACRWCGRSRDWPSVWPPRGCRRSSGGAEGVIADAGEDVRIRRAPANQPVGIGLAHGALGERAGVAEGGAEEEGLAVAGALRAIGLGAQVFLEVVV